MASDRGDAKSPTKGDARVTPSDRPADGEAAKPKAPDVEEIGGPKGPEPTRYGDWEKGGRCSDF